MKGTILDFSVQAGDGIISGDDNNRYKFSGTEWKASDAPARGQRVDFDIANGRATEVYREMAKAVIESRTEKPSEIELKGLPPYYQEEFKKIWESGEVYKGKWNWAAFFFGGFWALTKGTWLSAVISLGAAILTGGLGGVIYWFIFGFRGNYIYYTLHAKGKQLAA
jgi:hypothetical protein